MSEEEQDVVDYMLRYLCFALLLSLNKLFYVSIIREQHAISKFPNNTIIAFRPEGGYYTGKLVNDRPEGYGVSPQSIPLPYKL